VIDVAMLKVERAIFHRVPRSGDDTYTQPVFSDVEQTLSNTLEKYLHDQLVNTFGNSAQTVVVDEDQSSPLPSLVRKVLEDPSGFVDLSTTAAQVLYDEQPAIAPEGLLVALLGDVSGQRVLGLAKLEEQSGLSFDVRQEDGKQIIEVAVEEGLVLAGDVEVFKAALFALDPDDTATVAGIASDAQSGQLFRSPLSRYWLQSVLGFKYASAEDVQTREFYKAIVRAANSDIKDPAAGADLVDALSVELKSNKKTINPKKFIQENAPLEVQDAIFRRLTKMGAPTTTFHKSVTVAERAPKFRWFDFSDGIKVKVPLDTEVEISTEETDEGRRDILIVRGSIARIR